MNPRRRSRTHVRVGAAVFAAAAATFGATACGGGGRRGGVAEASRASSSTSSPTTAPVATTAALPAVRQRYAVGVRNDTYVDGSRPTSAAPGYGGAPDRTLPVTVWYPATGDPGGAVVADAAPDRSGAPYPLVLFSHGYAVTPAFYEELLTRWAAAGYVVAAPTYPLLSGEPGGPSHEDYAAVYADHRFVLDKVLADTGPGSGGHPLAGMVDAQRIAAAGQSDGEVAAFGAGFLECCSDPRVRAVVAMAGNLGNINNPVRSGNGVPILHLLGDADELQPYAQAIAWDRDNLTDPRWMVTLVGGTHAPPYRDPASPHFDGVVETTIAFLDGTLKDHPERLTAMADAIAASPDRFRLER